MTPGLFRFFLAFVVVVHHSFALRLGGWAVGMFFALSGFWISRMWRQKYARLDSPVRTFLVSRWWRLAPVFLSVNAITACLLLAGYSVGNGHAVTQWQWWVSQPLVAGSTQVTRLLAPSWSLDVEMQFYIVAPLIVAGLAIVSRRDLGLVVAALLGWALLRMMAGAPVDEARLDLHGWVFVTGCACERFDWRPSKKLQLLSVCALLMVGVAAISNSQTRSLVWQRGSSADTAAHSIHAAFYITMVIVGLPTALGTVYRSSGALDKWLGDLSFPLYMFHWVPRDWYYSRVDWTLPAWQNGLLLIANFLIALAGAIVLLHVVDRPAQRLRSRWMQSWKPSDSTHRSALVSNV